MRAAWTLLALALVLLAGCLALQNDPEPARTDAAPEAPAWHEAALAHGDDHDHADPAHHEGLTTPNFHTLGHDPLVTERFGASPGGSACASVDGDDDERIGAQKAGDNRGVVLTSLDDPAHPEYLGEFYLTGTYVYDVAVVPDGEHIALVTTQPHPPPDDENPLPLDPLTPTDSPTLEWESPCTDRPLDLTAQTTDPLPRPVSLILVDVSDPAQPAIADQRPLTGLGHSVHSTTADGRTWVLAVTDTLAPNTRHFHFHELTTIADQATLAPLSVYSANTAPDHLDYLTGHSDGWIEEHPLTGQPLAYLAAGPAFEIVDLTTPHAPERIAWWSDIGPDSEGDHVFHSVNTHWDPDAQRHYAIVGPEAGDRPATGPSGVVWVLDTTDPTQPEPTAAWTLPTDVEWDDRLQFSNHYMTVANDTLFVSTYHGGIWAVSLDGIHNGTPDDPALLDSLGVYLPTSDDAVHPRQGWRPWTPTVQDVYTLDDDTLVTFDANSGVHTFTFDTDAPMPTPEPWPIQPPPNVDAPPTPR